MKKLQSFIITTGVFIFVGLNVVAAQITPTNPDPPTPPPQEPDVVPIGDNIQYIVIIAIVFGLFIIHNKIKKQNSIQK